MNDYVVNFYPSEDIREEMEDVFNKEKAVLEGLLPNVIIEHVGSSAIPGALSKKDLDIQIRVLPHQFQDVLAIMNSNFLQKHPHLWTDDFAIFKSHEYQAPLDYMITVIDSKKDDFHKVRDFFKNHPEFLAEYNELKRAYEGKMYSEYRKAKTEFLGGNGTVRFLN
ncbi:MAG: GrpB family protein [Candidatus Paceibacterota bacterium]|jgi:GrpB-like predicted nucleotidyltransferase (UPF0157 family)